jgi:glycogen(starch) synthase
MRIAITTRLYFPLTGGVPVIARLLGTAWSRLGHEVVLLTSTTTAEPDTDEFQVIRQPTSADLWRAARQCDLVFQMEVSIRMLWPFTLCGKPAVVTHQTHFLDEGAPLELYRRVQRVVARFSHPVACSSVIRRSWGGHGLVIGNPYDESRFFPPAHDTSRPHELLFVGRLISAKGIDVLLEALARLSRENLHPRLRVIGDEKDAQGSQVPFWRQKAESLGLGPQIDFLGAKPLGEIAAEMRQARVLIVASTWQEPFGIVALEGLACGCRVIASSGGGLREAGGEFARYFENGSVEGLADAIRAELTTPPPAASTALHAHLHQHSATEVARRYLAHFETLLPLP